ncbi:efflux RND transporter periplasmic adaptor subunit [Patescibacteria group bacterium]|nr:efflux RND transporter periplasmic adaptor subunit [Patescibacteria group bacterium]
MQFQFKNLAFWQWRYALGVLAVAAIGGYVLFGRGANLGATLVIVPEDFREQASVSGTVTAAKNVDLGFAANGRIIGTYARVGQYVDAGTILAETENGDLIATVEEKKAALDALRAGTRPEQIAVAQAAVAEDQAALVNAIQAAYTASDDAVHNKTDVFFANPRTNPKLTFSMANAILQATVERDRTNTEPVLASWALVVTKLTADNAAESAQQSQAYLAQVTTLLADANAALNQSIPDQSNSAATLTSYATTLATARANVNTAATALTNALSALASAQKSLALDQAGAIAPDIAAAEAAVTNAQALLAKTRVVAPFGGIVTRMDAKVGEIVAPTTSEISMQSNGVFQIETYIPEVTIARVAVGDPATTTLDAYGSSVAFPSVVVSVDPAETVKDGVPTYKTTLSFLAADPRIRSGMTANVVIETGALRNAIVVPSGAIGADANGPYVSVMSAGKAVKRKVETGLSPALGQVVITSGLAAGDVIVLSPLP